MSLHAPPPPPPPNQPPTTSRVTTAKDTQRMLSRPANENLRNPTTPKIGLPQTGADGDASSDPHAANPSEGNQQVAVPKLPQGPSAIPSRRDRPQSSPWINGRPRGGSDLHLATTSTTPRVLNSFKSAGVGGGARQQSTEQRCHTPPHRPMTADGREIEAERHSVPLLDDPRDPAMIAHRQEHLKVHSVVRHRLFVVF